MDERRTQAEREAQTAGNVYVPEGAPEEAPDVDVPEVRVGGRELVIDDERFLVCNACGRAIEPKGDAIKYKRVDDNVTGDEFLIDLCPECHRAGPGSALSFADLAKDRADVDGVQPPVEDQTVQDLEKTQRFFELTFAVALVAMVGLLYYLNALVVLVSAVVGTVFFLFGYFAYSWQRDHGKYWQDDW